MDNTQQPSNGLRILQEIFEEYHSERQLIYDKLSHTLNNSDLRGEPIKEAKKYIEKIVDIEKYQEATGGFINQLSLPPEEEEQNKEQADDKEESEKEHDKE